MNWIDATLAGETRANADEARALLAKVEAGDTSTPLARRVQGFLRSYANGDAKFALWLALVDAHVTRRAHVGLFDLGDWPMRDAYDDGVPPSEAALEALRLDDTFGDFF